MKPILPSLTCIALAVGVLSGCANMNETQQGTAKGAGGRQAGNTAARDQDVSDFAHLAVSM